MIATMTSGRGARAVRSPGPTAVPDVPALGGGNRGTEAVFGTSADLRSAHHARKLVVRAARRWGVLSEASLGDLELCTGEIVANAVEHTGAAGVVHVSATGTAVRVEVVDTCPATPERGVQDSDSESGRGLFLVDALAARWGSHPTGGGKTVWFEIAADPEAAAGGMRQPGDHDMAGQRAAA
ncbi:ATP-binding protein [Kitasatospora sp. NPDC088346]|uniref:ATP-binding protein n=1 Tax=Kitasatospora sp. NPDC088346 TaxID=3364073 RepID=UPI0037FB078D